MKTVLCFGDSNTHGANPVWGPRFDLQTRWPGVLRRELGDEWWVIEEGLSGRTTVWDDPIELHKNGSAQLLPILQSHGPLDVVVILLGTNDLKARFHVGPDDVARGAGLLVDIARNSRSGPNWGPPQVLLLAPPPFAPLEPTPFKEMFAGGEEKSRRLGHWYGEIAKMRGCAFLDLAGVVNSSPIDGIHWEAPEHAKLARAVAAKLREICP
jgi:lysophospholipase L1-like esterase